MEEPAGEEDEKEEEHESRMRRLVAGAVDGAETVAISEGSWMK